MKTNSKKLWEKAKKIIPGGNGLLSKRPERFLPNGWPTFFKKASGVYIWDLNNKKYTEEIMLEIRKIADEVHRKIKLNKILPSFY